jgi:hypothetical protein
VNASVLLNVSTNGDNQAPILVPQGDVWYTILRTKSRDTTLGLLGVEARTSQPDLTSDEREIAVALIAQAELALEDRHLQQDVFDALKRIIPEIERVQRLRGTFRYAGSAGLETLTSDSPLMRLRVVQETMDLHDGNASRALRAVLGQAIDNLRPGGERRMTTAEWLLYNILELKFIQGLRVRDIAHRLAMSESDLYRKQRVAIKEVAQALAEMEQEQQNRS